MSRIPRRRLGRGVYHVFNRAINRQHIFREDHDRQMFLDLLVRHTAKYPVHVYHWCIMRSHFHLAIETIDIEDLSAIIGTVSRLFTIKHHQRHGGVGYLWQGRYRTKLVQKEGYLERLGRYIERNPVVAEYPDIKYAWEYPWSSASAYATGADDPLVDVGEHPHWNLMGGKPKDWRAPYKKYLLSRREMEEDMLLFGDRGPLVVGEPEFMTNAYRQKGRRTARRKGRPRKEKGE